MGGFIKQVFATLFALVLFLVCGLFLLGGIAASGKKTVIPSGATLHLTVPTSLHDYPSGAEAPFGDPPVTLHDLRMALRKAAVDERIERVVLQIGITDAGWAKMAELRQEIAAVRKAGKPVFAWCEWLTFRNYYLAAACDSVWMAPTGFIVFEGIHAERQFRRGLMDKIGIQARVHKIEKYKAAGEIDVRTDMSPEARENAQWILDETVDIVTTAIAADRKKDVAWVEAMVAATAPRATEAKELGLIDDLVYWNDLKDRWGGDGKGKGGDRIVTGAKYMKVPPASVGLRGKIKVAVIHAQGAIGGAKSGDNPFLGQMMGSETINAVVFRVDSPGGATYTSDLIRHQVAMLEREKPLVVSMGDVAGSGGYMIAYPCSMIVANEATRTGSIGSIIQLPNAAGLLAKIGLTTDRVSWGPNATMTSLSLPWSAAQESLVVRQHWKSYNEWVADIARVRGMTFEGVDSLGRGRVWTGRQALARGLVDKVGTLDDAIAIAAGMAGAKEGEKVTESHYPRQQTFLEALQSGDFAMARQILASAIWHEATDSARETMEGAAVVSQGDLSIMDSDLP
jgi:protease IV